MSQMLTLAGHLGRNYVIGEPRSVLTEGVAVSIDLCTMMEEIETMRSDMPRLAAYVNQHVWSSDVRTAFFLEGPLEYNIICSLVGDRTPLLDENPYMYSLLNDAIEAGANVPRLACGLASSLTHVAGDTPHVFALCVLLEHFAGHDEARHLIMDRELFQQLAARVETCEGIVAIANVIHTSRSYRIEVIAPVVERCTSVLVSTLRSTGQESRENEIHAALDLLERCTALLTWREYLVPRIVDMVSRTGFTLRLGTLLAQMLTTTSVRLVLELESRHRLDTFVHATIVHAGGGDASWRVVRTHLRRQWPDKFAKVRAAYATEGGVDVNMEESASAADVVSSNGHECPITLSEMTHPVVASDGNTYERDAILRHMHIFGMVSPLTKEPLEYHLYDNRCIRP